MTFIPSPDFTWHLVEERLRDAEEQRQARELRRHERANEAAATSASTDSPAIVTSESVATEALDRLATREDLRARFLAEASRTFKRVRGQANISPEEVAARAGVPQELVERVETGDPGECSLREFVELLQACDQVPFDLAAAPADAMRRFVVDDPAARATEAAFEDWQARHAVRRALRSATASSR